MSKSQASGSGNKGKDNIYHPTTSSLSTSPSKEFSVTSELEPFLRFSRHPQGILSLVLKRKVSMIRSKVQVTGQHTTTVFAPVKHKYKIPKACPAEVVGPPALEMGTTFPSLPCIPGRCLGQSVKSQDKTAPEGPQQGSLWDGLKHKSKKHILVCSAFAIPGEPRVAFCCQCLQGAAAGPSEWTGHHAPHCTSLCPIPTHDACWSEQNQAWQDQHIRENLSSSYPLNAVGETSPGSTCHPKCLTAALPIHKTLLILEPRRDHYDFQTLHHIGPEM